MSPPQAPKVSRRFARTLAADRFGEYERLLTAALKRGYDVVSLEPWVRAMPASTPVLILRHDVDQQPAAALRMARIELDLGLRSTFYFRWRTAHPAIIGELRGRGFDIGFHYETLTRLALEGAPPVDGEAGMEAARELLAREVAAFAGRFGAPRSLCAHGDSRVPGVSNAVLLRGQPAERFGVEFDANEAMRGRKPGWWLTDRSAPNGGWKDGVDPVELLGRGVTPILCLTHPNNWTSGLSLWSDRLLRATIGRRSGARPVVTGSDTPPL